MMKIYFDTLDQGQSNVRHLESNGDKTWWLVAPGSVIKKHLSEMQIPYDLLDSIDLPGLYFIDVNGDPIWWNGLAKSPSTPREHIILKLPDNIIQLAKAKLLRLIIAADREGGPMVNDHFDCFAATTNAIRSRGLPVDSVLIMQGNKKIETQYKQWLEKNNEEKLFEVMYSNHFGKIFFDSNLPKDPLIKHSIKNANSKSYNSLNRVYRPNRGAHLFRLAKEGLLKHGIVSANQVNSNDSIAAKLAGVQQHDLAEIFKNNFPLFIDGNWSNVNAANQYNTSIYTDSLLTVVTETIFMDETVFLTEKLFKPIAMGHPFITLAGAGTMQGLREMGFKIDFDGIDQSYDNELDPVKRFNMVHTVLVNWINMPFADKVSCIDRSMEDIKFNMKHLVSNDFYKDALKECITRSERYFND